MSGAKIMTTLQKLKDAGAGACVPRYKHLREALGEGFGMTTDLSLARILETNGLDDCLWALDHVVDGGDKIGWLFAADWIEHIHHIWLKHYPNDQRPMVAIKAARAYARGQITAAARAAVWDAARRAALVAARDAEWAAALAAVRAGERKWQTERLLAYLNGEVTEDWHAEEVVKA